MLAAEQLLGAVAGQVFNHVGIVLPAVVAPSRIALRILVGEDGAQHSQNFRISIVLGRDKLDAGLLAFLLPNERVENLGIVRFKQLAVGVHDFPWKSFLANGIGRTPKGIDPSLNSETLFPAREDLARMPLGGTSFFVLYTGLLAPPQV